VLCRFGRHKLRLISGCRMVSDDGTAQPPGTGADRSVDEVDRRLFNRCWACGQTNRLPADAVPDGRTAKDVAFTCGWCGAWTMADDTQVLHSSTPTGWRSFIEWVMPSKTLKRRCTRGLGRFCVAAVPALVICLMCTGCWILVPLLWDDFPTQVAPSLVITICLPTWGIVQILFYFIATATTRPGTPDSNVEFGSVLAAENGRFATFTLCRQCAMPRPPNTHHCSVCSACVHDMDHHCPYVHNCVGYENRRSFVLFLMFAAATCLYGVGIALFAMIVDRRAFYNVLLASSFASPQTCKRTVDDPRPWGLLLDSWAKPKPVLTRLTLKVIIGRLEAKHLKAFAFTGYLVLCTLVAGLLVGLLSGQLYALAHDSTYLDMLGKCPQAPRALSNIRRTLGPPSSWLCPRRGPWPEDFGGRPAPRRCATGAAVPASGKKDQ